MISCAWIFEPVLTQFSFQVINIFFPHETEVELHSYIVLHNAHVTHTRTKLTPHRPQTIVHRETQCIILCSYSNFNLLQETP